MVREHSNGQTKLTCIVVNGNSERCQAREPSQQAVAPSTLVNSMQETWKGEAQSPSSRTTSTLACSRIQCSMDWAPTHGRQGRLWPLYSRQLFLLWRSTTLLRGRSACSLATVAHLLVF